MNDKLDQILQYCEIIRELSHKADKAGVLEDDESVLNALFLVRERLFDLGHKARKLQATAAVEKTSKKSYYHHVRDLCVDIAAASTAINDEGFDSKEVLDLLKKALQILNDNKADRIGPPDSFDEEKMANSITRNQLLKMAEDLESPENETLLAANDEELDKVAESLVRAASHLREAADEMTEFEPEVGAITEEKLEQIAALAEAFSESDDELLQKQAGMLDDLLITLGSPKNAFLFTKAEEGDRIAELKKNYKDTAEKLKEYNKVSEAVKEIEKADVYKEYRPLEQGLSTRYCPDHAGVSAHRVGDHQIKCSLDGKVFDYNDGFTTQKGNKVPGTNVENQNMLDGHNTFSTFDSRADRMGFNNDQGSGNT